MSIKTLWARAMGYLASVFLGRSKIKKPGPRQYRDMEFPTSTQKIGARFTEKIRDTFRRRWIKKK